MTGTSVDTEEIYPANHDLPIPIEQCGDEGGASISRRDMITQSQTNSYNNEEENDNIYAYFATIIKQSNVTHYEYQMYAHENKEEDMREQKKNKKVTLLYPNSSLNRARYHTS